MVRPRTVVLAIFLVLVLECATHHSTCDGTNDAMAKLVSAKSTGRTAGKCTH